VADLPGTARVVIIGGGVVGTSCLYHLAKAGWSDCVLLEKNELTSGSTWHAAGNCPNFSGSWAIMKMQNYSTNLYQRLGDEVDYPMNYHVTGSIRLAHSKERMQEFEHVCSMAHYQGIDFRMLSNDDMKDIYPFLETHDLQGGIWDPGDGDIDPAQLTQAFAAGARQMGAKVVRFCPVSGVRREKGEWVIETGNGEIRCEYVVNAAGYYAADVGRMFGRDIPCVSLAHQYLVTDEIAELEAYGKKLPLLRDPDSSYYLRQEKNGLLLGPYEKGCKAHWQTADDPMPDDFSFQLYPDDLERLEWYLEDACSRVPILGSVGLKQVVNGPIPYAPDGNPLLGPMPGVPNAFEACVFTFGIVQGGGAGKILSEWVTEGETEWDMWSIDPRRFTGFVDNDYAVKKAIEIYSHEYAINFPHYEWPDGRQKRLSPLYDDLKARGAQFMAAAGWERVAWFARPGDDTELASCETFGRQGPWADAVREECLAVRDAAGICDLPGFSRFNISGEGAVDWLRTLITGAVPRPGRIGLVYFATPGGRILTEMTLTRFTEDSFQLLTAAGAEWHDGDYLRRHLPEGSAITIENVTEDWGTLVISGPKSRDILASVVGNDLSTENFSWLTHQPVDVAGGNGTMIRVSYVGELGWEIHLPNEHLKAAYDLILSAGEAHGLRHFGMYAMNSLRLEKCYRSWKADLSTDYTMLAGALDRFVKLDKPDFIGKAALEQEKQTGSPERFVPLLVEAEEEDAPYLATVWKGDERVGLVTSGGYGYRIERSIALATIRADLCEPGTDVEVEIYGQRVAAVVAEEALYDPSNDHLRT
jgi:dimethylglycine dehydrogenase